jgi:FKBP-type peptidyl-prolyl cis-trans isomerase (trigger factor)
MITKIKSREEKKLKNLKNQAKSALEKIKSTQSTESLVDLKLNILHRRIMKQACQDTPQSNSFNLQSCRNKHFKEDKDDAYFS